MSKTLKRAAFTLGILALAAAIFAAGGFAGRSLGGDSEEAEKAACEEDKVAAADALYRLLPLFEWPDIGTDYIPPSPDDLMCGAALELVDNLYEPSLARMERFREWLMENPGVIGGNIYDPVPRNIRNAIERYCE